MGLFILILLAFSNNGCSMNSCQATGARMLEYHFDKSLRSMEEFTKRLYARNPKYELDRSIRQKKIAAIFDEDKIWGELGGLPSQELLTAAFAKEPPVPDRVYLLGLGMAKSIREAYGLGDGKVMFVGLQIELARLERLHHNLSQVKWRLKSYRDADGELLFLTNGVCEDGYINMGYEVIMTEVLTRIEDDIYLRDGLPGKYLFDMSTMFLSVLI